jgi:hypothetical protein
MLGKEEARRSKEIMTGAAFTAWLQGAGGKKTFPQFLRHFGLAEKEKQMTKKSKKAAIQKALRTSARIMAMDKKRRPIK